MIMLYQIGDVAFHFHGKLYNGADHNGAGKATQLFRSHEIVWPSMQFQPEMRRQTIAGVLMGDCTWTADQVYQRLQTLVDLPTDIIGYINTACCDDRGCACQGSPGCRLVWYQNFGVLRSVKITNREDGTAIDITIEIEYGAYWRPLSRYFWEWASYTGERSTIPPILPYEDGITPYPRCGMIFCKTVQCMQFVKRNFDNCNLGYDPALWLEENCRLAPLYPKIGSAESWESGRVLRTYWNDATVWNAPLLSIYAFKRLPQTGIISIRVNRSYGVWSTIDETTTIDLAALSGALSAAGYGGLTSTDILYVGDVSRKPGFVMRGGVIIETPRPIITYPGEWPGYLTPGEMQLDINTPGGTLTAHSLMYRRM